MRINKFISETGYCSRRDVDKLIEMRKVTINGRLATLGSTVEEDDEVRVSGKVIGLKKAPMYIALNKPAGITSTTDERDPKNIVDYVGHKERIFPIGRLDKESEGLILMTNDGDIVNEILRAENNHEKEYIVTVDKPITSTFVRGMSNGVRILGAVTKECKVERLGERTFKIILTEGKNRQIRRMCEAFGYEVTRLQRVRIMNILLGDMKPGQWRDLTKEELTELFASLDYHKDVEAAVASVPEKKPRPAAPANANPRRSLKKSRKAERFVKGKPQEKKKFEDRGQQKGGRFEKGKDPSGRTENKPERFADGKPQKKFDNRGPQKGGRFDKGKATGGRPNTNKSERFVDGMPPEGFGEVEAKPRKGGKPQGKQGQFGAKGQPRGKGYEGRGEQGKGRPANGPRNDFAKGPKTGPKSGPKPGGKWRPKR